VAVTAVSAVALLIVFCSLVRMDQRFGGSPPNLRSRGRLVQPAADGERHGLFSIMTTKRREIVIEVGMSVEWHEYEFRYKPGDVARAPPWNIRISRASTGDVVRSTRQSAAAPSLVLGVPRTVAGERADRDGSACEQPLPTSRPFTCARSSTTTLCRQRERPPANGGTGNRWGSTSPRCI
jgi:hypothetical protein